MVTRACLRYAREGQNVTQAGPKCHTSRAKMSHKGQNVTQSCYNCRIKTGSGGVCCHNARGRVRNRKSNPDGIAGGIWRTVRTSPSALWQQTRQIGLNHNYNMTFLISPHGCPYSSLKWRSSRSKREPFRVLLPLLRHMAPLSDGKLLSHNAVVKGRCARDAIPWTFISKCLNAVKIILTQ